MYLLSPGGETLFLIPGVEVVHRVPDPINIPEEPKQIKTENMDGKMKPPTQVGGLKRQNLTLDLSSTSSKKQKVQNLLTSPDVQMLKLTSPELERFLVQNPTLATPTPSGYIFPKSVTEEQMMYAKGFEEALEHLRQTDKVIEAPNDATVAAANTLAALSTSRPSVKVNSIQTSQQNHSAQNLSLALPKTIPTIPTINSHFQLNSSSGDTDSYILPEGVKIKDEPDDQSLSGSESLQGSESFMSPVDMDSQEKIKLERKRLRNRLAASKCRQRKLDRISQLDDRVQQLKSENADLAAVVKKMKASIADLKEEVMEHMKSGCDIAVPSFS